MVWPICWMMTGARPSVGSSSIRKRAPVRRIRGDRQHLLLAARKFGALAVQAFLQVRKQIENLIERQAAAAHDRRQQQVFAHVEACENAALLGAESDAHPRDPVRRGADDFLIVEADRTGALADDSHHRFQRRGLAGAVAAEQRDHLAGIHVEIDAMKDVGFAVPGLQVGNGENLRVRRFGCGLGHFQISHDRPPDRLP